MKANFYYYIPENLDLEKLLSIYPPDFKFNIHKAHLFLSQLSILTSEETHVTRNGFVKMNSKAIQNLSIRDFPKYREWLILVGVILFDKTYVSASLGVPLSMRYRYTDNYYSSRLKLIPVTYWCHCKSMAARLSISISKNKTRLNEAFFNENLKVDIEMLKLDLLFEYEEEIRLGEIKNADRNYNSSIISAIKINQGIFYLTIDDTIGRHHSSIVELSKTVRNHLTYKGEHLAELDFSNAQLLFFTILLRPEFWKYDMSDMFPSLVDSPDTIEPQLFRYSSVCSKRSSDVKVSFDSPTMYMLAEKLQSHSIREFNRFVSLVEKGEIYKYLHNNFGLYSNKYNQQSRKEFKKSLITFTNSEVYYKSEFYKLFKKEFPAITKFLVELKRGNYKRLSHLLFNLETSLMYERIIPTIKLRRPIIVFYTIHDCILCTESNVNYVKTVMIEQTRIAFGVTPTIK